MCKSIILKYVHILILKQTLWNHLRISWSQWYDQFYLRFYYRDVFRICDGSKSFILYSTPSLMYICMLHNWVCADLNWQYLAFDIAPASSQPHTDYLNLLRTKKIDNQTWGWRTLLWIFVIINKRVLHNLFGMLRCYFLFVSVFLIVFIMDK